MGTFGDADATPAAPPLWGGFPASAKASSSSVSGGDGPTVPRDRCSQDRRAAASLDDERSALDVHAPILVISQFTLYGDWQGTSVGARRPRGRGRTLVDAVVADLRGRPARETGQFGAMMEVSW